MVPGGGISLDGDRWVSCRPGFFLPVRVLGRLYRGKCLALLRQAFAQGRLSFQGYLAPLADAEAFAAHLEPTYDTEWVVYAKPPFGGALQVLKYLARYTHRVAISNHRLLSLCAGRVRFRYKDYARGNRPRVLELSAVEFIRRFLLHVLPKGFVHIRHYGFLANPVRAKELPRCRELLAATREEATSDTAPDLDDLVPDFAWDPMIDAPGARCPQCQEGRIERHLLAPLPAPNPWDPPPGIDSS